MRTTFGSRSQILGLLMVAAVAAGACHYLRPLKEAKRGRASRSGASSKVRSKGFLNRAIEDDDGSRHRYMVFVPLTMTKNDRLPVMVYLNGFGENGDDAIMPMYNGLAMAIREHEQEFPFVAVWPQCETGDRWGMAGRSRARAIAILHQVEKEFHTDPDRVYLTGISSGGSGTWSMAGAHSDLFAAAIPASGTGERGDIDLVADANLPIWSYSVAGDDESVVDSARYAHQRLLEHGCSPHLTELPIEGESAYARHNSWDFAYRDEALYKWLAKQKRSNRDKVTPRFNLVAQELVPSKIESSKSDLATIQVDDESSMTNLSNANDSRVQLTRISGTELAELHLEFRPTLGLKRFGVGFFTGEALHEGALIDLSINDLTSSAISKWPGKEVIHASTGLGGNSVRPDAWNDLRIKIDEGRVSVEVNGWQAIDFGPCELITQNTLIGFVVDGEVETVVEVKNVRVRHHETTAGDGAQKPQNSIAASCLPPLEQVLASQNLDQIWQAWTMREKSFPNVQISWHQGKERRFAAAQFRETDRRAESPANDCSNRITLSPTVAEYSTMWQSSLTDFWRKMGIPCETRLDAYKRAMDMRFRIPLAFPPGTLIATAYWEDDRRIDTIAGSSSGSSADVCHVVVSHHPSITRNHTGDIDEASWRAPLLAFRPISRSGVAGCFDSCELISASSKLASVNCAVVQATLSVNGKSVAHRFWVDPNRGFLILRESISVDGVFRQQLDIEYSIDSRQQWIPSSWISLVQPTLASPILGSGFPGANWVRSVSSGEAVDCRYEQSAFPTSHDTEYPVGAVIFNRTTGEWLRQIAGGKQIKLDSNTIRQLTFSDN